MSADSLDMAERLRLVDRVDSELKRDEQETGIDFFATDDRFTITSYSASIVRSLLSHDEAKIEWIYATRGEEPTGRVTNPSTLLETDAAVEGVQATLPKGALTVKGTVRSRNTDAGIVNTPDDAKDAREAFTDGGTYNLPAIGSRVRDRDSEDGDEVVVIETHSLARASEFVIDELDETVAEVNPEYDQHAPVVEAVYVDEADRQLPWWESVEDLADAVEGGAINSYSFPCDRLVGDEGAWA